MLVSGGPGIGKSRFVKEVAEEALTAGFVVLRGRATMAVNSEPYRPLAEAVAAGARASGLPDAPELAPYRPFLGRLVPEWRVRDPVEDGIAMIGEAVVRLLAVLGRDVGCLVVLEDLHWSDPETIAIVEYLADHVASEPVVCGDLPIRRHADCDGGTARARVTAGSGCWRAGPAMCDEL